LAPPAAGFGLAIGCTGLFFRYTDGAGAVASGSSTFTQSRRVGFSSQVGLDSSGDASAALAPIANPSEMTVSDKVLMRFRLCLQPWIACQTINMRLQLQQLWALRLK
jgi:hypothetical protein